MLYNVIRRKRNPLVKPRKKIASENPISPEVPAAPAGNGATGLGNGDAVSEAEPGVLGGQAAEEKAGELAVMVTDVVGLSDSASPGEPVRSKSAKRQHHG